MVSSLHRVYGLSGAARENNKCDLWEAFYNKSNSRYTSIYILAFKIHKKCASSIGRIVAFLYAYDAILVYKFPYTYYLCYIIFHTCTKYLLSEEYKNKA